MFTTPKLSLQPFLFSFLFLAFFEVPHHAAAQNVGIGNTNPAQKLEVTGNLLFSRGTSRQIIMEDAASGGGSNLFILGADGAGGSMDDGGDILIYAGDDPLSGLQDANGGDVRIRGGNGGVDDGNITLNGNTAGLVGVGTLNPSARLDVDDGRLRIRDLGNGTSNQNLQVDQNGVVIVGGGGGLWLDNGTNLYPDPSLAFPTRGVAIGKGAVAAEALLDIQGDIQLSEGCFGGCACRRIKVGDCSSGTDFILEGSDGNGSSFANGGHIILQPGNGEVSGDDGNVGIRTLTPTFDLSVNGSAGKTGGGMWSTFSDRRLKKDIQPYQEGLSVLQEIQPVTFKYNGKAGVHQSMLYRDFVGVIAQDLRAVAAHMVSEFEYQDDGEKYPEMYLNVDPSAFTYMLINATKEQQNLIEAQQAQLELQQAQIDALTERLNALSKTLGQTSSQK